MDNLDALINLRTAMNKEDKVNEIVFYDSIIKDEKIVNEEQITEESLEVFDLNLKVEVGRGRIYT